MKKLLEDAQTDPSVLVLCSGFGLGFYIPGLLIRDRFRSMGIAAKAEVFESLISASKLEIVERNRQAYHSDFRVALASQRIPNDIRQSLDASSVASLLARWQIEDRRKFISLSGHWSHILELYRLQRPDVALHIDLLHLDAAASPSWKQMRKLIPGYAAGCRETNLYDAALDRVLYRVSTNAGEPLPFGKRNGRLVVHGGGWGIGTYQDRISDLETAGFCLDVVGYMPTDIAFGPPSRRYYLENSLWKTWHLDETGDCQYPPSGVLLSGAEKVSVPLQSGHHSLYEVIRNAMAIVSKPGAGTLIDSLGTATPLIMLEPFGAHEEANAKVWKASGFGISYHDWDSAGRPIAMLEKLHSNLVEQREQIRDYAQAFAADVMQQMGA